MWTWAATKEYSGYALGLLGGAVGLGKYAADRSAKLKAQRTEEIDGRIVAIMNPELLHEKLSAIIDGQKCTNEKLDELQGRVTHVEGGVAWLSGLMNERRGDPSGPYVVGTSDSKLHARRAGAGEKP